jgi:IMP dehydrogenase
LVGILTNRDVRFASDPDQKVYELMTRDNLITVRESVNQNEAKRLLHQNRIEKLLVVDDADHCVGLITVKDMEKSQLHPTPPRTSRAACVSPLPRPSVRMATSAPNAWSMPVWM